LKRTSKGLIVRGEDQITLSPELSDQSRSNCGQYCSKAPFVPIIAPRTEWMYHLFPSHSEYRRFLVGGSTLPLAMRVEPGEERLLE
jgi:hypothetical protein